MHWQLFVSLAPSPLSTVQFAAESEIVKIFIIGQYSKQNYMNICR